MNEVSSERIDNLSTLCHRCQCLRPIGKVKSSPGQSKDADIVCRKYGPQFRQLGGWQPETVPLRERPRQAAGAALEQ